jgi:hypothetical protein
MLLSGRQIKISERTRKKVQKDSSLAGVNLNRVIPVIRFEECFRYVHMTAQDFPHICNVFKGPFATCLAGTIFKHACYRLFYDYPLCSKFTF